jgi:hypothetical protein
MNETKYYIREYIQRNKKMQEGERPKPRPPVLQTARIR